MRLVDGAAALVVALRLARVDPVPVDAPLEEPRATFKVKEGGNSNYLPFHQFYKYSPPLQPFNTFFRITYFPLILA